MGRTISRRSLLFGLGSLTLTQLVSACQFWQRLPQFLAEFLASSIPATLLKQFQSQIKNKATLKPMPIAQLSEGMLSIRPEKTSGNPLQNLPFIGSRTPKNPTLPDVASLADSWLQTAIQRQQLEPLNVANDSNAAWQTVPPAFQALVTRNAQGFLDSAGSIWGAPYRWGHLMIAYRVDQMPKIAQPITDWQDLWQDDLKGHLSLLNSDRVVLGIVLKSLGQSINTTTLDTVPTLEQRLATLNEQVKFYSSDSYLQPLLLKDTWVAVGWSTDILPLVRRDRRINAIVPKSGTILTADVWVKPTAKAKDKGNSQSNPGPSSEPSPEENPLNDKLVRQWMDFFWKPSIATQLALLSSGASPVLLSSPREELPLALANDALLMPSVDIMDKSEFLDPLDEEAIALYQRYWSAMRQS